MLCTRCEKVWVKLGHPSASATTGGLSRAAGIGQLGSLYCASCGSALPLHDGTDRLLEKLSQLALFGLSAADQPILAAEAHRHERPLCPADEGGLDPSQ